jgi:initiation factor 1A
MPIMKKLNHKNITINNNNNNNDDEEEEEAFPFAYEGDNFASSIVDARNVLYASGVAGFWKFNDATPILLAVPIDKAALIEEPQDEPVIVVGKNCDYDDKDEKDEKDEKDDDEAADADSIDDIPSRCHPHRNDSDAAAPPSFGDPASLSSFDLPEVHETEADKEGIKIRTEYTVKEGRLIKVVSHVRVVTEIITRLSKAAMARRQRMCPFGDARTGGCVTTRERKDFFLEAPRAAMEEDDDNDQAVILKKITERRNVLVRPKKPSLFPNGSNGGGGGSGGNVTCSAASDDEAPPSFRFEWEDANDRKLQVLNCGDETTEADLQDLFRALFARMRPGGGGGGGGFRGGPVENVFMPRDKKTGESLGSAYVTFADRRSAEAALEGLQGHRYGHVVLFLQWAPPRKEKEPFVWQKKKKKKKKKKPAMTAAPLAVAGSAPMAPTAAAAKKVAKEAPASSNEEAAAPSAKALVEFKASDGQVYARVEKLLGGGHCELCCLDGRARLGRFAGSLFSQSRKKKKNSKGGGRWKVSAGDIVIAEPWAFQDDKAHVVRRYDASEARRLLACGELPPGTRIGPLLSVDEELLRRGIDETYDMGIDFDYSEEIDGI